MDDPRKPPCTSIGQGLNWCAKLRYAEQILGHVDLPQEWLGWKFRGRNLVSPDGYKVAPEQLRGILMRVEIEKKRFARGQPTAAAVVQLRLFEDTGPAASEAGRKRASHTGG